MAHDGKAEQSVQVQHLAYGSHVKHPQILRPDIAQMQTARIPDFSGEAWRSIADEVEDLLGYRFQDQTLLKCALTHRSFANEWKMKQAAMDYKVNSKQFIDWTGSEAPASSQEPAKAPPSALIYYPEKDVLVQEHVPTALTYYPQKNLYVDEPEDASQALTYFPPVGNYEAPQEEWEDKSVSRRDAGDWACRSDPIGGEQSVGEAGERSFTYISSAPPGSPEHYEALEFLGDRVLNLITSLRVFEHGQKHGGMALHEGVLSTTAQQWSRNTSCAQCTLGLNIDMDRHLRVGRGHRRDMDVSQNYIPVLADTFEAVMGAIFLDSGKTLAEPTKLWNRAVIGALSSKQAREVVSVRSTAITKGAGKKGSPSLESPLNRAILSLDPDWVGRFQEIILSRNYGVSVNHGDVPFGFEFFDHPGSTLHRRQFGCRLLFGRHGIKQIFWISAIHFAKKAHVKRATSAEFLVVLCSCANFSRIFRSLRTGQYRNFIEFADSVAIGLGYNSNIPFSASQDFPLNPEFFDLVQKNNDMNAGLHPQQFAICCALVTLAKSNRHHLRPAVLPEWTSTVEMGLETLDVIAEYLDDFALETQKHSTPAAIPTVEEVPLSPEDVERIVTYAATHCWTMTALRRMPKNERPLCQIHNEWVYKALNCTNKFHCGVGNCSKRYRCKGVWLVAACGCVIPRAEKLAIGRTTRPEKIRSLKEAAQQLKSTPGIAADAVTPVTAQGFLMKMAEGALMKKRLFILSRKTLYWFETEKSQQAVGVLLLERDTCSVSRVSNHINIKKSGGPDLHLQAHHSDSNVEATIQMWLNCIRDAIEAPRDAEITEAHGAQQQQALGVLDTQPPNDEAGGVFDKYSAQGDIAGTAHVQSGVLNIRPPTVGQQYSAQGDTAGTAHLQSGVLNIRPPTVGQRGVLGIRPPTVGQRGVLEIKAPTFGQ